jgi:hypothetical protein
MIVESFDHIPSPGEPLKEEIHPDNQKEMQLKVAERVELLKAKLTRWQRFKLQRRYNRLHSILNRKQWNRLVNERDELSERLAMVKAAYRKKPTQRLKAEGIEIVANGKLISAKIARLRPLAAEFEAVAAKLNAHRRVVELERQEIQDRAEFYREAGVWEQQILAVFRQSPRLHYIYKTSKKEEIRIPQIQQIILKPDKIYYQIRTTSQNLIDKWLGVWRSALPYGVDIRSLTSDDTLENLTAACGRVVTVERSKRSQNLFYVVSRLDSADGIPNRIIYDQVIEHYPTERHEKTPFVGGVGQDRKAIAFDFEEYPHVLIGGASGGGKSNFINQLLATLITMNTPEQLRLVLIDNKGGVELSHFDSIPHLLYPTITQTSDVLPALVDVRKILNERLAAFKTIGARTLQKFNQKAKQKIPRIIVIVDEMATIIGLGGLTADIHNELRVITSQGRAVGINMVICTQHPSVDVLPGWIKTNMTLRIASKMPNHVSSQIVVDSISASILPDVPGRMVFRRGGFEMVLQTPLIEDAGVRRAVKLARAFQTDGGGPAPVPVPTVQSFSEEDFIGIAVEKLDNHLSANRAHELLSNDVVTLRALREVMHAVVKRAEREGGIMHKEKCYQVIKKGRGYYLIEQQEPVERTIEQTLIESLDTELFHHVEITPTN